MIPMMQHMDQDAEHVGGERRGSYFFLARLSAAARAFSFARSGVARPFFVTCRARPKATAPAGTSSVITLPAVTLAPRPMRTGATSALLEPMNAPGPTTVRHLPKPS